MGDMFKGVKSKMGLAFLNQDNSNFFFNHGDRRLSKADVDSWVDLHANTQIDALVMCVNCMKTNYPSKVWEPIWEGYDSEAGDDQPLFESLPPEGRTNARRWVNCAWQLYKDGIDIYKCWIDRCRFHGISPWISMRMNDIHSVDDERSYLHSRFWREHPEMRRVPYRFAEWTDAAFDYGIKEVRDYHFALIREIVERYDMDGLELDWMRFGFHFRPGFEGEGLKILTGFMKDVRELLDQWQVIRGHEIKLSARIPSRPQTARGLGMDAVLWAKMGLVDILVVTPFWATIETDMPIEIWKQLLEGTDVTLLAGVEVLIRAYPDSPLRQYNSIETLRGATMSLLDRGADGIYLFNYMESKSSITAVDTINYYSLLQEAGNLDIIKSKPRRYVMTYADTWAPGEPQAIPLPAWCRPGQYKTFRMYMDSDSKDMPAIIGLGLASQEKITEADCEVLLNGTPCNWLGPVTLDKPYPEEIVYGFEVQDRAIHRGYNAIEVKFRKEVKVTWVEIKVD